MVEFITFLTKCDSLLKLRDNELRMIKVEHANEKTKKGFFMLNMKVFVAMRL